MTGIETLLQTKNYKKLKTINFNDHSTEKEFPTETINNEIVGAFLMKDFTHMKQVFLSTLSIRVLRIQCYYILAIVFQQTDDLESMKLLNTQIINSNQIFKVDAKTLKIVIDVLLRHKSCHSLHILMDKMLFHDRIEACCDPKLVIFLNENGYTKIAAKLFEYISLNALNLYETMIFDTIKDLKPLSPKKETEKEIHTLETAKPLMGRNFIEYCKQHDLIQPIENARKFMKQKIIDEMCGEDAKNKDELLEMYFNKIGCPFKFYERFYAFRIDDKADYDCRYVSDCYTTKGFSLKKDEFKIMYRHFPIDGAHTYEVIIDVMGVKLIKTTPKGVFVYNCSGYLNEEEANLFAYATFGAWWDVVRTKTMTLTGDK